MAISTYKVFLMHKGTGSDYEKLLDIKGIPDLGGEPEMLQTTTLSDKMHTYIPGIQSSEGMNFGANYTKADYTACQALEGKDEAYAVWFGGTEGTDGQVTPTGEDGKFEFSGRLSVYVNGGGVNEVVGMTVSIAPSTIISLASA